MVADFNAWIVCFRLTFLQQSRWTKLRWKQEANHLVIDPEHVGDVDADVNGVHLVGVGEVKLIVVLDKSKHLWILKVTIFKQVNAPGAGKGACSALC